MTLSRGAAFHHFAALLGAATLAACAGTAPDRSPARPLPFPAAPAVSTRVEALPQAGQDAGRVDRDRYECHIDAVKQSRFDPSERPPRGEEAASYRRAAVACFETRGYVVK